MTDPETPFAELFEVDGRILAAGFSQAELTAYIKHWVTGEGYDAYREAIDAITALRMREDF